MRAFPERLKEVLNKLDEPILVVSEKGVVLYPNDKFLTFWGLKKEEIVGKRFVEIFLDEDTERVLHIFKSMSDIMFKLRGDGTFLDCFGDEKNFLLPPEEFLGKKIQDVMPDNIGVNALKKIKKTLKTGEIEKIEYKLPLPYPDGKMHFYEARIVKSGEDEVLIIVRDVTERVEWEKKLRESEELFKLLTETVPSAIFIHDGERYIYVNSQMEEMAGYSKEELLTMKLWELIHPDYREEVKRFAKRRILGKEASAKYNIKILTKDRKERWLSMFDITELKKAEESLKQSEKKFKGIFENAAIGITLVDRNGNLIECNPYFSELVGYSKEELMGKHWSIYTHPGDVKMNVDLFERMIKEKRSFVFEKRFRRRDGKILWGRVTISPVFDSNGKFLFQIGITENIAKEKEAIEALKESESKYRTLVEKMSEGVYILYNNKFEFVNDRFVEIFGYTREELRSIDFRKLVAPESLPTIEERARKLKMGEPVPDKYEFIALDKHGKKLYVEVSVTYVPHKGGTATQGIVRDITEKKIYEEKLKYMATHDILTGLPNRTYFMDFLRTAIESSKRYGHLTCVVMIDLDGFKDINDKFGHDVGDKVLVKVAERLKNTVRRSDILSRLGGDEFLVLVPILKSATDAIGVGRKIVNSFREPLEMDGALYNITVSVGAAIFPQNGADAIELIKKADRAMYKVKRSGKNGFSLYSNFIKES